MGRPILAVEDAKAQLPVGKGGRDEWTLYFWARYWTEKRGMKKSMQVRGI